MAKDFACGRLSAIDIDAHSTEDLEAKRKIILDARRRYNMRLKINRLVSEKEKIDMAKDLILEVLNG
jgi:hypothetical protein